MADDGVRVWLDGIPLIDEWHENDNKTHTAPIWIEQGDHEVRVEYLEMGGDARVRVWWDLITTFAYWRGAYYANADLAGRPAWVRDDEQIAFDWGDAGPGHNLPNDNFSVRWSRTLDLEAGTYRFWAYADDGVRITLDDQVIIDQWRDSPAEDLELFLALEAGEHELVVGLLRTGRSSCGARGLGCGWDAHAHRHADRGDNADCGRNGHAHGWPAHGHGPTYRYSSSGHRHGAAYANHCATYSDGRSHSDAGAQRCADGYARGNGHARADRRAISDGGRRAYAGRDLAGRYRQRLTSRDGLVSIKEDQPACPSAMILLPTKAMTRRLCLWISPKRLAPTKAK